ncbi:MAG: hypothetical protein RL065_2273 [Bacteroidota bacterium]|jgi:hypothetical protein
MYEKKHEPLAHKKILYSRLLRSAFVTCIVLSLWLILGVVGYHVTCHFSWIDSLLNASMILSGMGPTSVIETDLGKIFASFYAIFSGVIFITSIGVLLAPMVHRIMHQFHLPEE